MSVKLIGIEIEGAFTQKYDRSDTNFHTDGSVEIDNDAYECDCCNESCDCYDRELECECHCESGSIGKVGELLSIPLPFNKIHEWLNRNYPQVFNNSCGMHVHLSFKNDYEYSKFCSKEFYDYFLDNITKWAIKNGVKKDSGFFYRLNGNNSYCKRRYDEAENKEQMSDLGDRYNIINYCYNKHRTIEIRLSHVWQNRDYAFSYIEACYDIFNTWLLNQKRSTRRKLTIMEVA